MAEPQQISVQNTTYWYFERLPTAKQLQKYRPNVVRMQDRLRPLLERGLITALIDCEWLQRHDYVHHRGSGLDMVLVTIAAQHNIIIFVNMTAILNQPAEKQVVLLGRIMQNEQLCAKKGVTIQRLQQHTSTQYVFEK